MRDMEQIPEQALSWHQAGKGAVLATVVQTWGSAPRRVGSQLVVSRNGEMAGSVSGGCVEGAVVAEALEMLETGAKDGRMLDFGVSDDDAFAVGLACGGEIRVWVEPVAAMGEDLLAELVAARKARRPIAYVFAPGSDARALCAFEQYPDRFRADASGFEATQFVHIHNPPLRMIVVGAVHIAQALLPMARLAGYHPILVDPRPAFAAEARFPGEEIVEDWPDEALAEIGLDGRTCVVTLTHDPKLDDPAIRAALGSDVFYLGCLGSNRTHAKRVERLQDAGFRADDIARIHGPVGLDIGSAGPGEIAVSIMAEITKVLRRP